MSAAALATTPHAECQDLLASIALSAAAEGVRTLIVFVGEPDVLTLNVAAFCDVLRASLALTHRAGAADRGLAHLWCANVPEGSRTALQRFTNARLLALPARPTAGSFARGLLASPVVGAPAYTTLVLLRTTRQAAVDDVTLSDAGLRELAAAAPQLRSIVSVAFRFTTECPAATHVSFERAEHDATFRQASQEATLPLMGPATGATAGGESPRRAATVATPPPAESPTSARRGESPGPAAPLLAKSAAEEHGVIRGRWAVDRHGAPHNHIEVAGGRPSVFVHADRMPFNFDREAAVTFPQEHCIRVAFRVRDNGASGVMAVSVRVLGSHTDPSGGAAAGRHWQETGEVVPGFKGGVGHVRSDADGSRLFLHHAHSAFRCFVKEGMRVAFERRPNPDQARFPDQMIAHNVREAPPLPSAKPTAASLCRPAASLARPSAPAAWQRSADLSTSTSSSSAAADLAASSRGALFGLALRRA